MMQSFYFLLDLYIHAVWLIYGLARLAKELMFDGY